MIGNEKSSKSSHIGNNWKQLETYFTPKTPNVLLTNFVTLHRLINKNVIYILKP